MPRDVPLGGVKFLVDAQLPERRTRLLLDAGHDALHTVTAAVERIHCGKLAFSSALADVVLHKFRARAATEPLTAVAT